MTVLTLADPTLVKEMEEIAAKRQTAPDLLLRQVVRQFLDNRLNSVKILQKS